MKNIFKNSKRGIAAILTLCILLGIAGTCVYAASIPEENTVHTEETAQELMPMMARGCGYNLPDDFLNGGRWTDNYGYIESHLVQYHGGNSASISNNLHAIKSYFGLTANYNCIFDMTGGVHNQNGGYLLLCII